MPEVLKNILLVLAGAVGLLLIMCLVVAIGCSINGLQFGEQICAWFGGGDLLQQAANAMAQTPIA